MNGNIWLGIIFGISALIVLFYRVPSVMLFLSLLIGNLMVQYTTPDIYQFFGALFNSQSPANIKLILFFTPIVLTALFLRHATPRTKMLFEIVPAIFCGAMATILLVPIFPTLRSALDPNSVWQIINAYNNLIVVLASTVILLDVWLVYPRSHGLRHKK